MVLAPPGVPQAGRLRVGKEYQVLQEPHLISSHLAR